MTQMTPQDIKDIIQVLCKTTLGVMGIKLLMCAISEILCKTCHSCGKKASGKF